MLVLARPCLGAAQSPASVQILDALPFLDAVPVRPVPLGHQARISSDAWDAGPAAVPVRPSQAVVLPDHLRGAGRKSVCRAGSLPEPMTTIPLPPAVVEEERCKPAAVLSAA